MDRKLVAILAADVVGYSALMEQDEAGTHQRLQAVRQELFAPTIAQHHGAVFKLMGDGMLAEFSSVVEAVECAVALQTVLLDRNAAIPEGHRIIMRIGINLGEVIVEGDDRFGEGVNIAARLEQLADPGSIFVSGAVHSQVRGKLTVAFEDIGKHAVKNLAEPVHVYRVVDSRIGDLVAAPNSKPGTRASIAVLPFDNMSGDAEQSYFSDGITEDIITELSKFRELKVIARNSSFQFRGSVTDIRTVAQKLGVAFVVEGSVRKMGNRIRVTAQLIESATSAHVWAERYDRELSDVFTIQDEISRAVASRVANISQSVIAGHVRSRPTASLSAYDCYLRGRELFINYDTGLDCIPYLQRAIALDPEFAIPHALMSDALCFRHGFDGQRQHLVEALEAARTALALDAKEPWASYSMALVLTRLGHLEEAGHFHERAHALNPNNAYTTAVYADWLSMAGRDDEAVSMIAEALSLDPYAYDWFWDARAKILTVAGLYRESVASFRRLKSMEGVPSRSYCYQAINHIELGDISAARAALDRCRVVSGGRSPEAVFADEVFIDQTTTKRLIGSLRKISEA